MRQYGRGGVGVQHAVKLAATEILLANLPNAVANRVSMHFVLLCHFSGFRFVFDS